MLRYQENIALPSSPWLSMGLSICPRPIPCIISWHLHIILATVKWDETYKLCKAFNSSCIYDSIAGLIKPLHQLLNVRSHVQMHIFIRDPTGCFTLRPPAGSSHILKEFNFQQGQTALNYIMNSRPSMRMHPSYRGNTTHRAFM